MKYLIDEPQRQESKNEVELRFRLNNVDGDMNFEVYVDENWERICFVSKDGGKPTLHLQTMLPKGFVRG